MNPTQQYASVLIIAGAIMATSQYHYIIIAGLLYTIVGIFHILR